MCGSMVDIQSLRLLRLGEEKKEDRNYKAMGDHCPVISIDRATIKT